jgi:hypothetical protein
MPSYLQLQSEPEWGAQFTPPVMNAALLGPLRSHYNLGPASVGAAGDNNHLYGRHRSYNWAKQSIYCTDRSYGTTDQRDQGGNRNWYRGFDVGIQGDELYAASHRMDALARSGQCPGLAEWFGTFNGAVVVGWFEGHPSTSDDSHLSHLHGGVWNSYADDAATMQLLYATITGVDMAITEQDVHFIWEGYLAPEGYNMRDHLLVAEQAAQDAKAQVVALEVKVDQILAALTGGVTVAAEVALNDDGIAAVRDAIADGLEGGSAALRAAFP